MRSHRLDWFGLKPEASYGVEGSGNFICPAYVNGGSIEINEGISLEKVIGGVVAVASPIEVSVSVDFLLTPSLLSILDDLMVNEVSYTIAAGSGSDFGVKVLGCFPTEISISCEAGEPVKVSAKFDGQLVVPVPPPVVPPSGVIIHWWGVVVTLAGNEVAARSAKLDVRKPVQLVADLSTNKPEGARRVRNRYAFGIPEVTLSATLLHPFMLEVTEDTPDPVTWTLTVGGGTISGVGFITRRSFPIKGGDDLWTFDIEIQSFPNLTFS